MKKALCLVVAVGILMVFLGCGVRAEAEGASVVYEAVFLENEEVRSLFCEVRGDEAPHAIMTKDFHVTSAFMPAQDMHEYYGTEVTVCIYAYQDGEITADDGSTTANEGFFCTIKTDNEVLQDYFDHLEKNWHITGSYQDQGGAKYTEYLDLTGAQKVEYTVTGRFGGYMTDGSFSFTPAA